MRGSARVILALALLFTAGMAAAKDMPRERQTIRISVITILPGKSLYSAFGHTAFRVVDESAGTDIFYNYGASARDFDWKFFADMLIGKMPFTVIFQPTKTAFLYYGEVENRTIIEQPLNLDSDQILSLLRRLEGDTAAGKVYNYRYFTENCTTKPWEILNPLMEVDGGIGQLFPSATLRSEIRKDLGTRSWRAFFIDMLLGPAADRTKGNFMTVFLPRQLMEILKAARTASSGFREFAQAPAVLHAAADPGQSEFQLSPMHAIIAIFLAALLLSTFKPGLIGHIFDLAIFGLAGIGGIGILLFWFGAGYPEVGWNWNLLWANPIPFAAVIMPFRRRNSSLFKGLFLAIAILAAFVALFGGSGFQDIALWPRLLAAAIALRCWKRASVSAVRSSSRAAKA